MTPKPSQEKQLKVVGLQGMGDCASRTVATQASPRALRSPPFGECQLSQGDELELVVHDVWRDVRLLSCAPASKLASNKPDLIEAREALNDVLAKIEQAEERSVVA